MSASNTTGELTAAAENGRPIDAKNSGQWTTGLFDCFDDFDNCFKTFCCPFITFGRNAEIIDKGRTSAGDAARNYYILGNFGCAVSAASNVLFVKTQEHRELRNRGFDPTIGWAANVAKMNPPAVEPGMVAP
ncbi:hypothetical protein HRI_001217300 [Hibiscus trionum]|uniref:Uncharacterized protein n=1 Tax=Hibiscus trionum TaxID=183268 RepID=A0A9W7HD95_HIBTR|nr:hypothetical protein HRI_001217300 [Hibiscus trionum]